ncbi:MAG: hydantoinase/oxoprolinase family protein, partial [Candidatus Tectomicrobia bacterium]|nr:hydantoinase/oxoprolinase family protein [Candidatus Tectomicrobia bacterium]
MRYRIGIDSGGTFTDVMVAGEDGRIYSLKIPSTPRDPSLSFLEGIRRALEELEAGPEQVAAVLHGTTVATNALLESKFPPIGLVVTRGFREILEIARQTVPGEWGSIYVWVKPPRVVPLERVQEVAERVGPRGEIQVPLNEVEMRAVARWFKERGIEAVAISFLHSYINPAHELRARQILEEEHPEGHLSTSWETLPEFREYERTLTTCLNAALKPVLSRYLSGLSSKMARLGVRSPLQIMKSAGGVMDADRAIVQPVYTVLSGPSAAVLGMASLGRQAGYPDLITLDMGGTSTDVSMIERGRPLVSTLGEVDIYPIK